MIELEFAVDAAGLGDVLRAKPVNWRREGRARSQTMRIVWHDSPEHALRKAGLVLGEQRGLWRLERLSPGAETWLPGQPAPVLAEAGQPSELPSLPVSLAPQAAFEGRRTISVHVAEAGPVTLTTAGGVLRAVTEERSAARVWLRGEPAALRDFIPVMAEFAPISVPRASLPAEGLALAIGARPVPRQVGAPKLPQQPLSVPDALRLILGHLTDVILAYAPLAHRADPAGIEAVHQMRVAVRRARSALTIFRPALPPGSLDTLRDGLKLLGGRLGPTRDWDVFVTETAPLLQHGLPGEERLDRLVAAAERQRRECRKMLSDYLDSPQFRMLGIDLAWFAASFNPEPVEGMPDLSGFAAQVIGQRHRKLVSSGKRMAGMDIPALHGVRLRAKQVRYAAEMFATLHPGRSTERFIRRLSVLQQRLGVLNDGAVAGSLMGQLGGASGRHAYAAGIVVGFLAARTSKIQPRIIRAFDKFRRQSPYWA